LLGKNKQVPQIWAGERHSMCLHKAATSGCMSSLIKEQTICIGAFLNLCPFPAEETLTWLHRLRLDRPATLLENIGLVQFS